MIRGLIGVCLFTLGALALYGWQHLALGERLFTPKQPVPEKSSAMGTHPIEGIGYIEPRSEIRRLSFKIGGVLRRCGKKPGDTVHQGEVLAELDDCSAAAAVEIAKRRLTVAKAQLSEVKAGVNPHRIAVAVQTVAKLREQARHYNTEALRHKSLSGTPSVSQTDVAEAKTKAIQAEIALQEQEAELTYLKNMVTPEQLALAEAKVRQTEAEVVDSEQQQANTKLTAPIDGVILKYLKREGEGVSPLMPPEPVVLFGDLSRLRIRAEIDERQVHRLRVGQTAEVYGRNAGHKTYSGKVVEIEKTMGHKTLFSQTASERKDLHVLQILIEMEEQFAAPIGLQVEVRVQPE